VIDFQTNGGPVEYDFACDGNSHPTFADRSIICTGDAAVGFDFTSMANGTVLSKSHRTRAFDIDSGRELWSGELLASAQATPMTYSVGGKQYVVIGARGHGRAGSKIGDSVVAFALP
jgi:hypothetical protein